LAFPALGRALLLVGHRAGALAAARRLGFETYLLDRAAPGARTRRSLVRWASCERDPASAEAAARELLGDVQPAAVVALAEWAVAPAARIRAALGLPGLAAARALPGRAPGRLPHRRGQRGRPPHRHGPRRRLVGWIEIAAPERAAAVEVLRAARAAVRIEME